jgi:putative heme-binding domain-containing protein
VRTNGPTALFRVTPGAGGGPATVERVAQLVGNVGDHGPHAIRRGPDGSIMIMSGNNSGTPLNQYIDPTSRILNDTGAQFLPTLGGGGGSQREGVHSALYRLDPAAAKYTVITGGNRNTYDFAYNLIGEAFWYDSDHEPEIGVPWYREVRSVHGIPGGNYGYRDGTGKLPPWYIDTLPPLRDLDRGSPVGVETYQSYAYPREYFDMLLEADWSRGRLLYTTLTPNGATYRPLPGAPEFLHGEPLNITDLEVAPDGMIYFTTGGRATKGGFWRIRWTGPTPPQPDMTGILAVVRQPQPLSAWSWARIESVKARMGEAAFGAELEKVARNTAMDDMDRVRALYEMQRHGPAPGDALLQALITDADDMVRAAAVYVAGRRNLQSSGATTNGATAAIRTALTDENALVRRRALEALVELGQRADRPSLIPVSEIYARLADPDRFVRWSARIALERSPRAEWADRVIAEANVTAVMEGILAWVRTNPDGASFDAVLDKQFQLMAQNGLTVDDQVRLLRVFHYTTTEMPEAGLDDARRERLFGLWANRFPAIDERLNREVALTLAYSKQPGAIAEILAAMPVGDSNRIMTQHYLYALRAITTGWTTAQKMQVADVFASTAGWRGGMGGALGQMWDAFMTFYTEDEKQMAYQRAPNYAPLTPAEMNALAGRGGGGGGRGGGRGGVLVSKDERFESLLFRADQRGGDFLGRNLPADPVAGRAIFERECASCHKAGGVGTSAGTPDFTGNQLARREILESIFWPERKVDARYHTTVLETADGRTLRGIVVSETGGTIALKTAAEAAPLQVQSAQVKSRRVEPTTIMPDLFDRLAQNEINELVAFIQSQSQVASR